MGANESTVLLVDDDTAITTVLGALLKQAGFQPLIASSGDEAIRILLTGRGIDVVVSDVRMPGVDGMELLQTIVAGWPETPVILLTAHGTVATAVEAMKRGAADFVMKPFDREEILFCVRSAITKSRADVPPQPLAAGATATQAVGSSPALRQVLDTVRKAARTQATVLVRGESGVGKELVARDLHRSSPRAAAPFVKVHLAALPDTLLESELFGYEKGAFTGAATRKPGRLELAEGGSLFLDEIGDISPALQVKLLRVLQDGEYERLGGTQTLRANVRWIAATHQPLEQLVAEKKFREDLYYRLNVVSIEVPPLRARTEDIGPLAEHFARQLGLRHRGSPVTLTPQAGEALRAQSWPGNIRQLENFIERVIVLTTEGVLDEKAIAAQLSSGKGAHTLSSQRQGAERAAILEALQAAGGNRTQAARLLNISRRTLYNKLDEFGIDA